MDVFCTGLESQAGRDQAAEREWYCRALAGDPDRVRDNDGVGGKLSDVVFDKRLEVRAPDLFLELPYKLEIDADVVAGGITCGQQRGQRGPL